MRSKVMIGLALALTLAACGDRERAPLGAPVAPAFAHAQDLDGTPDLMVDSKRLATSWTLSAETIEEGSCSSVEGGIAPGEHRLLRFTVTTPNVGTADVFVGDPVRHWVANDGMFEFAPCHRHFHFRHYATYELVSASSGAVLLAAKRGFCMVDVHPWGADEPPGPWTYRSCGTFGTPGNQGISVGWASFSSSMGLRVSTGCASRSTRRSPAGPTTPRGRAMRTDSVTCSRKAITGTTSDKWTSPSPTAWGRRDSDRVPNKTSRRTRVRVRC
jgi:lysyl oxidase